MTETEGRVRRALDGDSGTLRSRIVPLDDIEILSRAKGGDGRTVVAYAATFGSPAEINDQDGHYSEENHPQAFDKTVAERGLRFGVFYHHGKTLHGTPSERGSVPLGRPVLVKPDGKGLLTHSAYNRTQLADDVLESIRNGDPMGMSYTGAYLQSDPPKPPYYSRSDGSLQHVVRKEIALIEYGPTPMPAFADAEILGVRAAQAREAERAAAGADGTRPDGALPYARRDGENVQCPDCGAYNEADANYCDQCGDPLPDSAFRDGRQPYQQEGQETVQCPACGRYNEPDAVYCDQCGKQLPGSAYEGDPAMPGGTDAMSGIATGDPPGRAMSTARHEPVNGTHSHAHPAYGAQGGDATHTHEHSHDGDANHAHSHAAPDAASDGGDDGMSGRSETHGRALTAAEKTKFQADIANSSKNPVHDLSAAIRRLSQYAGSGNYPKNVSYADLKWMYDQICGELNKRDPQSTAGGNFPPQTRSADPDATLPDGSGTAPGDPDEDEGERCQAMQDAFASAGSRSASPDSMSDSGTSGRTQTTPAATGTGAGRPATEAAPAPTVEPHEHSTAPATPTSEGTDVVEPTIEQRAARRSEIDSRILAISGEYGERALPPDIQAEWDALSAEADEHTRALEDHERALTVRRERVAAIAARQTAPSGQVPGERVNGTSAGYTAPAGTGERGAPSFIPGRTDEDIYDVAAVRSRALSPDDAAQAYRDRAMRAVERATFPGSRARERSQATVERLLASIDDEEGTLAQRVMLTGSPLYVRAWSKLMARMSPMGLSPEELAVLDRGRALAVGTGSAGGFAVPFELDPTVILTSNGAINPLRQISRIATITGKEYDLVTSAGVTVSRSAEGSAMGDNTPTLAQPTIKANRVTGFIPFSMEIEQDWHALQSEMMMLLADAKDVEEANSFTLGDGTGVNAGGIITTLSTASVLAGTTTATLASADLYALEDNMAPRFRPQASWMASKTTYNAYRQLFTAIASAAGDPWVRPSQGQPAELLGYAAYEASDMVGTHASGDKVIILGDFGRGFIIVDRVGMSVEIAPVLFDQATGRPTGQRGLIAFWRNNSRVLVDNAFRLGKVL